MDDNWTAGGSYENYMGRWSRPLARSFVSWLTPPAGANWLDVGCGTGALTQAICDRAAPGWVLACDPSPSFVDYAREKLSDVRATFVVASAESLPQPRGEVDYIVLGLALNFLSDPRRSIASMRELVRRDGTVAAYVWDYGKGVEFLRCFWDEAVRIDPAAATLDEGHRFSLCQPEVLSALFSDGGFQDVQGGSLQITMAFQNFEDFWTPFAKGTGPAPSYAASLSKDHRDLLRERLSKRMKREADGSIRLQAGAWAIRGTAPS